MTQTLSAVEVQGFQFVIDLANDLSSGYFDIPAFPDNTVRITTALENPDITAEQAARVVDADPVFSARLLQVANSVMFNPSGVKISDLNSAIACVGFKQAYNTVMSVTLKQVMLSDITERLRPCLKKLWHHSVQVAACSYVIAWKHGRINPDTAMLAGLVHDIGRFYIITHGENYPGLFDDMETLSHITDDWHTAIGRGILEEWNFSDELLEVADEHEDLKRETYNEADLVDIVTVANLFSLQIESEDHHCDADWEHVKAFDRLKLSAESVAEIYRDYYEEIDSMIRALEGDMPG